MGWTVQEAGKMYERKTEGQSCWEATAQMPSYPALSRSLDTDVVVVGGGIAGITSAYLLKQAGIRVALLEKARCGGGQTGRSTAHLTAVTDVPLTRLIPRVGADRARQHWEAGFSAISRIRAEVRDARINCEFGWVRGCLHAPLDQPVAEARVQLTREAAAASAVGIGATYVDMVPGLGRPGVWFDGQARLHPLRYLSVLLDRIDGDGSHVFEHTPVDEIDPATLQVRAGRCIVSARYIVVATQLDPLTAPDCGAIDLSLTTSYAVSGVVPHGGLQEGLYWEHRDSPYGYLRIDRGASADEVFFGGVDSAGPEPADAVDRWARLERQLAIRVPGTRVSHRWSGTIVESADGLPCIGEVRPGVFLATGFGGNGMTYGTLAGLMAVDAARGARSPWSGLFDPRRSTVSVGRTSRPLAGCEVS